MSKFEQEVLEYLIQYLREDNTIIEMDSPVQDFGNKIVECSSHTLYPSVALPWVNIENNNPALVAWALLNLIYSQLVLSGPIYIYAKGSKFINISKDNMVYSVLILRIYNENL